MPLKIKPKSTKNANRLELENIKAQVLEKQTKNEQEHEKEFPIITKEELTLHAEKRKKAYDFKKAASYKVIDKVELNSTKVPMNKRVENKLSDVDIIKYAMSKNTKTYTKFVDPKILQDSIKISNRISN